MHTIAETEVIDMVDHDELLILFQEYVSACIEESTHRSPSHPLGFDEWHATIFKLSLEEHTAVIPVTLTWERASGGFLCGSESRTFSIRVPSCLLTEHGGIVDDAGFRRICRKFAHRMNRRLPSVAYRGQRGYHWTW